MTKSAARAIGSELGRQVLRGVLGSILGGKNVEKRALSAAAYRGWGIAFAVLGVLPSRCARFSSSFPMRTHPVADHAPLPANDDLAALLPRHRLVAAQAGAAAHRPRLGGRRGARLPRLLRGELPRLHRPPVRRGGDRADPVSLPDPGPRAFVRLPAQAPHRDAARRAGADLCSIALVVSDQVGASPEGKLFLLGVLLVFASALCYATYLVAERAREARGLDALHRLQHGVATAPAIVQFFVFDGTASLELPAAVWMYAAILGTLSTVVPVFLQAEALKRIGAPNSR